MFTDPEEARSDLFLAGAVYLFGPLLLRLVLPPLTGIPVLGVVVVVVAPLLTTALVPVLLARYRGERADHYGLSRVNGDEARLGLLLAAPIVGAATLAWLVGNGGIPLTLLTRLGSTEAVVAFLRNAAAWVGLGVLAVYATVKARDAFRAEIEAVSETVQRIGRVLGIAGGVAALLLLVALRGLSAEVVLLPLGFAGAVVLLLRDVDRATTTRAALLAPTVLLVLGPLDLFSLFIDAGAFVQGVWGGALAGTAGMLVGATLETRRSAGPAVVLVAALALFTLSGFPV